MNAQKVGKWNKEKCWNLPVEKSGIYKRLLIFAKFAVEGPSPRVFRGARGPHYVMSTDASDEGWGGSLSLGGREIASVAQHWTPQQKAKHITWREAFASSQGLLFFLPQMAESLQSDSQVRLYFDSVCMEKGQQAGGIERIGGFSIVGGRKARGVCKFRVGGRARKSESGLVVKKRGPQKLSVKPCSFSRSVSTLPGPAGNRSFCQQEKPALQNVLQLEGGPPESGERLPGGMVEMDIHLDKSAVGSDTPSFEKNQSRKSPRNFMPALLADSSVVEVSSGDSQGSTHGGKEPVIVPRAKWRTLSRAWLPQCWKLHLRLSLNRLLVAFFRVEKLEQAPINNYGPPVRGSHVCHRH